MNIKRLKNTDDLWEKLIEYSKNCSWMAGKHLSTIMKNNSFQDWESVFVVLNNDEIVGYCTFLKTDYYPNNKYFPWISTIFVDEKYRGHRISEILINKTIEYAKTLNFKKVYIPSDIIGLYEKYGFKCIDKLENYDGDFDNIYEKEIDDKEEMNYKIESYGSERFNEKYDDLYNFLLNNADKGINEHFHFARFEWMMAHTFLDESSLEKITIFRDKNNEIVGFITYDCTIDDSMYLIHSINDSELLNLMIDFCIENNFKTIKTNDKDVELNSLLVKKGFNNSSEHNNLLSFNINEELAFELPKEYKLSFKNQEIDRLKYQEVIHKGFGGDDNYEPWNKNIWEIFDKTIHGYNQLKVFAIKDNEYCAHCGIWYVSNDTAYIEPVVTIPSHRNKGLAKAVVYEAINRARKLGAKRAVVLSELDFYYKIGFKKSSEIITWSK